MIRYSLAVSLAIISLLPSLRRWPRVSAEATASNPGAGDGDGAALLLSLRWPVVGNNYSSGWQRSEGQRNRCLTADCESPRPTPIPLPAWK